VEEFLQEETNAHNVQRRIDALVRESRCAGKNYATFDGGPSE